MTDYNDRITQLELKVLYLLSQEQRINHFLDMSLRDIIKLASLVSMAKAN